MLRFQLFILIVLLPLSSSAADPWIGQKVFWKDGAIAKVGNKQVNIELIPFPERVEDVNGDWLWLGRAWVRKSDVMLTQQALEYFTDEIRRSPSIAKLWQRRGAAWNEKGETDNAIKDLSEAIRLDPKYKFAYTSRGVAWERKKDYDRAIADYNEAIRLDPKDVFPCTNRGNAWAAKKDYDRAIVDYNEAIRLDPKYASAYSGRGIAWFRKQDYDRAIVDYNEAIRLDPKDAIYHNNRGNAWQNKQDYDRAIVDYNEAIRLDPKYVQAYNNRGKTWKDKKEYDRAITDYNEAIRLDPKAARSHNSLAWLLATCAEERYRNGNRAVALSTRACELSGWKTWYCVGTLAAAYAEAGDFGSAIKYQNQAIDLNPNDAEAVKGERERLALYEDKKPYRE